VCRFPSTYATLCFKEIKVPPKIRVLPSGTLSQTLDFENFATAHCWLVSDSWWSDVDSNDLAATGDIASASYSIGLGPVTDFFVALDVV